MSMTGGSLDMEYKTVDALRELSKYLLAHPELAFKEYLAHDACIEFLKMHCDGWKITPNAYGLETAWEAVYTQGMGGRRIVFCSEYDALPDIGHACGHNLICVGGIAAALGAVEKLKEHPNQAGEVVLLGTPAEEGSGSSERGGGKYYLLDGGAFKGATASLMLHPGTDNVAFFSSAAIATCVITYRGKPAHAAASPWEGCNALDALVLAHSAIGLLRQQLCPSDRIHGNITGGGQAVNIIPAYCTAMYGVRSPDPMRVKELMIKLENCFKGAAIATSTELTIKWTRTLDVGDGNRIAGLNVHSNEKMAKRFQDYLSREGIKFSPDGGLLSNASTDFGGVTYAVPGIHPIYEIGCGSGEGNHTYGFTKHASTDYAFQQTLKFADGLANVGWDILRDELFAQQITEEFKAWRKSIKI